MWSNVFFYRPFLQTLALVGASLWLTLSAVPASASPAHVLWAEEIALNVTPENNEYGSNPTFLTWPGVQNVTIYTNRTKCASFVTHVLKQAYGWNNTDVHTRFDSSTPDAATYHDAIQAGKYFLEIQHVKDIQVGDIIAIKYPPNPDATGHVMIASNTPVQRRVTKPVVAGTTQYAIEVIDSSQSGHGPTDTRLMRNDTWDEGAGIGILRLYADNTGAIVGYTWSTYNNSDYYDQTTRHLTVGRLK
jgi:hypothetical protein